MIARDRYRLAVDFGTSTTIAMLQWPDGRIRPLLFDGSPLLPSAIVLGLDGQLHTGRDAAHLARGNPERLETNPKRRIDDGAVLLGDVEVPVPDLFGAVLRRVVVEAGQVAGPVAEVTLTHPATWGARRRALLVEAAERVGLARPNLVSEPVAAAAYFARVGAEIRPGAAIMVYDLGAGTCDVTVLRRQQHGFDVAVSGGLGDVGGLDVDAAIVAFLEATYGRLWTDTASRRQLWDEVRTAKEMLSRASSTVVAIPVLGTQVPLGREQLDGLARPVLRPTTALAKQLLRDANLGGGPIAGLYLVGGSSKIPLCATLLHEALGVAPVITEQPELVVAEGSLHATSAAASSPFWEQGPTAAQQTPASGVPISGVPVAGLPISSPPVSSPPVSGPPVSGPPVSGPPVSGRHARTSRQRPEVLIVAAIVAFLLLAAGGVVVGYQWLDRTPATGDKGTANPTTSRAAVAPKFPLDRLPERPCDKVDIGPLIGIFEGQTAAPVQHKNLATTVSTFSCIHNREHLRDGITAATGLLMVNGNIYADNGAATDQHKTNQANAGVNGGGPTAVDGIGQEAFVYRNKGNTDAATTADYILDVRDGNLIWRARLVATQIGKGAPGWSSQELTRLQTQFIASAKASYGRLNAG